jgi:hypothetical protein
VTDEKKEAKPRPVARPGSRPMDLEAVYRDTLRRFPETMTLLAE